jgi:signal transduction histidine kinase
VTRQRELDALRAEFVATASHELRTPITVIAGFADTLQQRWDELGEARARQFVELIGRASHDLERLVEDLLQVARIEQRVLPVAFEPVDLGREARAVASQLDPEGVRVSVEGDEAGIVAWADPRRQRQVLANLVANALAYAPGDSPVLIRIGTVGSCAEVAVVDQGPGIAPADRPRLFEKFQRLESSHGAARGSGLGLYITRSLVELQGGSIDVDSTPGVGSTFRYTVPLADAAGRGRA